MHYHRRRGLEPMDYINIPGGLTLYDFQHQLPCSMTAENCWTRTLFDLGVSTTVHRLANPTRQYNLKLVGTKSEMYTFLLFFIDRQARLKTFYYQEPYDAIELASDVGAGETVLTLTTSTPLQSPLDCLCLRFGTTYIVSPIVQIVGDEVTIQDALPEDVPKSAQAGFAFRCRFNQDELTVTALGGDMVSTDMSIIEVLKSPKEI